MPRHFRPYRALSAMRSVFSSSRPAGRRAAAVGASALLAAGMFGASPSTAGAQTIDPVDVFLTVTGEPGPHRVPGAYFTSPGVPDEAESIRPSVLVGPSTPLVVGESLCTAAVAGYDAAGNAVAITAGHCGVAGDEVRSGDDPDGTLIGTYVRGGAQDNGIILLNGNARVTNTYNNASLSTLGGGAPTTVCKTGITTGTSCGPAVMQVGDDLVTHLCAAHGDSGAPVYAGNRLVGVLSGGLSSVPACVTPLQGAAHSPVFVSAWDSVAAEMDAAGGVGAGFHLA